MRSLFLACIFAFLSVNANAQSETRTHHGNIRVYNGSVMIASNTSERGENIHLFVSDKHVITSNLLTLSAQDAILLRDALNAALKNVEANYCKRTNNCSQSENISGQKLN